MSRPRVIKRMSTSSSRTSTCKVHADTIYRLAQQRKQTWNQVSRKDLNVQKRDRSVRDKTGRKVEVAAADEEHGPFGDFP